MGESVEIKLRMRKVFVLPFTHPVHVSILSLYFLSLTRNKQVLALYF